MTPCEPTRCRSFGDGHGAHPSRVQRTAGTPWGWRDGIVTAVDGGRATVLYVLEDGAPSVWHHADLPLAVHEPVRLHEQFRMLGTPRGWFCVVVESGRGPVPMPEHPELSAADRNTAIVDLETGVGVDTEYGD